MNHVYSINIVYNDVVINKFPIIIGGLKDCYKELVESDSMKTYLKSYKDDLAHIKFKICHINLSLIRPKMDKFEVECPEYNFSEDQNII